MRMERSDRFEAEMVARLSSALGEDLLSVVVYGPAAHEDSYPQRTGEHVLIVARDLEAAALRRLASPVQWWLKKGEPWPRLFSPELLHASIDVFPIEQVDLASHRRVVFGEDPIAHVQIDRALLRLQCERELREKLMRLREGYVEAAGRTAEKLMLRELLVVSYTSFVRIFRGCLYLLGTAIPRRDSDVVQELCIRLDLAAAPFEAVEQVVRGDGGDVVATFGRYYEALTVVEYRIDRMIVQRERRTS
jgi:hypothetical protein